MTFRRVDDKDQELDQISECRAASPRDCRRRPKRAGYDGGIGTVPASPIINKRLTERRETRGLGLRSLNTGVNEEMAAA